MAPAPPAERPVGICLIGPELPLLSTKGLGAAIKSRDDKGGRKRKKTEISTDEENVPRVGDVFSAIGEILYQQHEYRTAMTYLDAAVELDANNKRPYLTRALCLIKLGRYREALLELDKTAEAKGTRSLALRALAYWNMGEFEKSAYTAARGVRGGGFKPLFKGMFYTSIGSIERCIGPSAGEMSKDILQMEEEKHKLSRRTTARDRRCEAFKQGRSTYLMQLHLGRLAVDNRFISSLQSQPGFPSANQTGMETMASLIDCAKYEMLVKLEEMLMDMPMYVHRRIAVIPKSQRMLALDEDKERKAAQDAGKQAEDLLLKVLAALDKGVLLESLNVAVGARTAISAIPKKLLPEKTAYLTAIYHILGIMILEGHQRIQDVPEVVNHTRTLQWLGLKRSLIQVFMGGSQFPFYDCRKVLNGAMTAYPVAKSHLERAWLLYLISVCNAAYNNYDGCRNHARRCVTEARLGGSKVWTILGLVMQAHSELHLNSKLDAKTSIKDALEIAQELRNEDTIEVLIQMNEAIEQQSQDADTAAEEVRFHRSLVTMMPTQTMKNKMRHVLHHRSCMPPPRRLPISVRRDTAPNLGDTAEDADRPARPALWPRKKKSL